MFFLISAGGLVWLWVAGGPGVAGGGHGSGVAGGPGWSGVAME